MRLPPRPALLASLSAVGTAAVLAEVERRGQPDARLPGLALPHGISGRSLGGDDDPAGQGGQKHAGCRSLPDLVSTRPRMVPARGIEPRTY